MHKTKKIAFKKTRDNFSSFPHHFIETLNTQHSSKKVSPLLLAIALGGQTVVTPFPLSLTAHDTCSVFRTLCAVQKYGSTRLALNKGGWHEKYN
jgi:hypothetical protein